MQVLIGQRVIYEGVICTVCRPEIGVAPDAQKPWIDNPEKGYRHWVSIDNLKPLPNGQL